MTDVLTPKEKECLYWAGRRLSDAEIAHRLDLSPRTVGNHLSRAYSKLGVRDRIRAAAKLSELYPEYPLPIGYEDDDASPPTPSARPLIPSRRRNELMPTLEARQDSLPSFHGRQTG